MAEDMAVASNVDFLTGRWWKNSSLRLDRASGVVIWTGMKAERRFALPGSPAVGLPTLAAVVVTESFYWTRGKFEGRHQEISKLFLLVDSDGRALAGLLPSTPPRFDLYWPLHALRTVRDWGVELRVLDHPASPADLERLYPGAGPLAEATSPSTRAVLITIAGFIAMLAAMALGKAALHH